MPPVSRSRTLRRCVWLVLGVAVAGVLFEKLRPRDTPFGDIEKTHYSAGYAPGQVERIWNKLMSALGLSFTTNTLKLDGNAMDWTLRSSSDKTGYLYFDGKWEFAPTTCGELEDLVVDDLRVEFVKQGDVSAINKRFFVTPRAIVPETSDGFVGVGLTCEIGGSSDGNVIIVQDGQVILARRASDPGIVYAIKLRNQGLSDGRNEESIELHYVTIDLEDEGFGRR